MLMDLFFQHVSVQAKKRVHFHEWMMQVITARVYIIFGKIQMVEMI